MCIRIPKWQSKWHSESPCHKYLDNLSSRPAKMVGVRNADLDRNVPTSVVMLLLIGALRLDEDKFNSAKVHHLIARTRVSSNKLLQRV